MWPIEKFGLEICNRGLFERDTYSLRCSVEWFGSSHSRLLLASNWHICWIAHAPTEYVIRSSLRRQQILRCLVIALPLHRGSSLIFGGGVLALALFWTWIHPCWSQVRWFPSQYEIPLPYLDCVWVESIRVDVLIFFFRSQQNYISRPNHNSWGSLMSWFHKK